MPINTARLAASDAGARLFVVPFAPALAGAEEIRKGVARAMGGGW
jgi:hypothetical protein